MQDETRKIMHLPELRVSATCVRVPVYRAHSVAVTAEFERPVSVEQAREVLSKAPGLELVDDRIAIIIPCRSMWLEKIIVRLAACVWIARWRTGCRFGFQATNCSKARR